MKSLKTTNTPAAAAAAATTVQSQEKYVDFYLHKLVLSLNSGFFEEFFSEFEANQHDTTYLVEQLKGTPVPSVQSSRIRWPYPIIVIEAPFKALRKFIKFIYTQQLDLDRKNSTKKERAFMSKEDELQTARDKVNLLFDLYELAFHFDVEELSYRVERDLRSLMACDNVHICLDRLANLIFVINKLKAEQDATTATSKSESTSESHHQPLIFQFRLNERKMNSFRLFKHTIMRFFIRNLNQILKNRPDFLNVEFKLNERRQLIYDELCKYYSRK